MSYLNQHRFDLGAESQADAQLSVDSLRYRENALIEEIKQLDSTASVKRAIKEVELANILVELDQPGRVWQIAKPAIEELLTHRQWEHAVVGCDTLFRSGHEDNLTALGNGLWLAITFPVPVDLSVRMLQHVVEETPEDSDGSAVAAGVAAYIFELRGESAGSETALVAGQLLNDVARQHGGVTDQEQFNRWFEKLELDDPSKMLVRMRNIIDVLVQDDWWYDRDKLQSLIPRD